MATKVIVKGPTTTTTSQEFGGTPTSKAGEREKKGSKRVGGSLPSPKR